jgi:hypothetical protein
MAATGSTYRTCGCRDGAGRRLRARCPKLRRADGRWSTTHGSWNYQLEMPLHADGTRRNPLRRSGFATQDAAEEVNQAKELLAIAGGDTEISVQIADLITTSVRTTKTLPIPEEVPRARSASATT